MKHEIINKQSEIIERKGMGYKEMEKYDLKDEELIGNFEFSHAKYKKIIEEICEDWSPATNSDFFLYIEVLRCLGLCQVTSGSKNFVFTIPRDKLKFIPSHESIRRARQSLNQHGFCLPDNPIVIKRRLLRERKIRKFFQKEKKDEVINGKMYTN